MVYLSGQMLVFRNPGIRHVFGRVIYHRNRLELLLMPRLMLETERPVRQLSITKVEILVNRPRVDEFVIMYVVCDLAEVRIEHNLDVPMIEHVFEHARITVKRHHLKAVVEVPIVVASAGWYSRGY